MKTIVWITVFICQTSLALAQPKFDDEFDLVANTFKEKFRIAISPLIDAQNENANDSKEYRLLKMSQEDVYIQKAAFLVEDFKKQMLSEKNKVYSRQEIYDMLARGFKYEFMGLTAEFYADIRKTLKL